MVRKQLGKAETQLPAEDRASWFIPCKINLSIFLPLITSKTWQAKVQLGMFSLRFAVSSSLD
jgi:hypothetical protein